MIHRPPHRLRSLYRTTALSLLLLTSCLNSTKAAVLWNEGFEQNDFWSRWHSEGGLWAVGAPTVGPEKPFAGARCAATLLDSDYPPSLDTRLVRERVFVVPSASLNPRLRFWQWFRAAPGASRAVEVRAGTADWQPLQAVTAWTSNTWAQGTFDLRPFAGQALQLAFHFKSDGDTNTAAGWYLDEVSVEANDHPATLPDAPEDFEEGLGNWTVENGLWQAGTPATGPQAAWSGANCAIATLPAGANTADSRLVSPEFVIAATDQTTFLTFQHWSDLKTAAGSVEVREVDGDWQSLGTATKGTSGGWATGEYDLTAFVGKLIQVAFRFQAMDDAAEEATWLVDQVQIQMQTANPPPTPPTIRIEQVNAEMVMLCPEGPDSPSSYILEACDDLSRPSEPGHWVELGTVEPGACATVYSSLSKFRLFRLRSTNP